MDTRGCPDMNDSSFAQVDFSFQFPQMQVTIIVHCIIILNAIDPF